MTRRSRAIAVGYPHHVTQRGNDRRVVFVEDGDYARYRGWLAYYSRKFRLDIWAYCLMPNHVHVVAVPQESNSLSQTFKLVNMQYAQYYNDKTGSTGHLWQGRYFSCVLDELHTQVAVRYVEVNPVRGGLSASAEAYAWSSAASHVLGKPDAVLSGDCFLTETIGDWRQYLTAEADTTAHRQLIRSTQSGHPCGQETFIREMEALAGRQFILRSVGRPRRKKPAETWE